MGVNLPPRLAQQVVEGLPPAGSADAQPCPRLICPSRCVFAFILICTSTLGPLSAAAYA